MERLQEIEARKLELRELLQDETKEVDIEEVKTEIESLEAEEKEIEEKVKETTTEEIEGKEKRKEIVQQIEERKIMPNEIKESVKMDIKELRNSQQYVEAYANYIKTGEDAELRSLLTTNVDNGTIAVPDFVYDEIKTAWDQEGIMALVHKAELKGNIKVNFEISGTDAVVHTEGSGPVSEEELIEGIVTIVPAHIKKWISFSDEVMSMRGEAFLRYIYAELTYRIVKKAADLVVSMIAALPQTANSTTPSARKINVAPAADTIAQGIANLSDEANNPVIIMNKLTYAEFKRVQYANNYGVDVFEGLKVLFNNTLPAYSAASNGAVYCIVGDLDHGTLANFPNGINNVEFKLDELSRKKEDLVECLGKEYVGLGVVADKSFTLISKPASI